jgi:tRNA (guanosine-2'-O-)-methyltransferase
MIYRTEQRIQRLKSVLKKRQTTLIVVLENINDPHNLSASLRSCDAVGIYEVCLVYDGNQPFPKLGAKSSASARKWIQIRKYKSIEDCYTELRQEEKKIFTTHLSKESVSLYDIDLTKPTALVFGNEHSGVSEEAVKLADGNFLIPQVGIIQSLNISVAVAVSVYEAFRQRLEAGMYDKPQFKKTELKKLLEEWGRK